MIWLLHGNLGDIHDWEPVITGLESQGHKCRTINLWKHLECCPKSLHEMGKILCSEIGAQDKHPIICGYSLGGRLAMQALLAYPPLWKAAIFISSNPGLSNEQERAKRREIDTQWAVKCLNLPWSDFLQEWDSQEVLQSPTKRDRNTLKSWKKAIARGFMEWSVGKQEDLREPLAQIPCPQLWITGQNDLKFTQYMDSLLKGDTIALNNVGHRIIIDDPNECAKAIHRWLSSIRDIGGL